jgi:hypothetical protein
LMFPKLTLVHAGCLTIVQVDRNISTSSAIVFLRARYD